MKAHELGSAAITGALIRSNVRPEEVSDVIMGQVSVKNIAALEKLGIYCKCRYN